MLVDFLRPLFLQKLLFAIPQAAVKQVDIVIHVTQRMCGLSVVKPCMWHLLLKLGFIKATGVHEGGDIKGDTLKMNPVVLK